ncbi:PD-(D/E)XK motif protein [Streptomyces canus]|uniref:PD-(D/E)XK motif protein n=1 Tax=Streptomyces canus TaxID=58343 RepID=UPI002E294A11|nr:PD-(D/E)XK motif protein [Streptomyces canus]
MNELRSVLDEHWDRLEAEPAPHTDVLRTSVLPVETSHGPVLAAVDVTGARHLMIPLRARQRIAETPVGAALTIRERPLQNEDGYTRYADIACGRRELGDVFTGLCRDVLVALEADSTRPYHTARVVVDRWRQLFAPLPRALTPAQVTGLFGELLVLVRLLEDDPDAVRHWVGPEGDRHDFSDGLRAVEVKSVVTASERRSVQVHGLDQLEAPAGGSLLLAWHRLEAHPEGESLPELVTRVRRLCGDELALLGKLAHLGYRPSGEDHRHEPRLRLAESRWHLVDDDFPRLTAASLIGQAPPVGVLDVQYTVDLAAVRTAPLDDAAVDDLLGHMGERA